MFRGIRNIIKSEPQLGKGGFYSELNKHTRDKAYAEKERSNEESGTFVTKQKSN